MRYDVVEASLFVRNREKLRHLLEPESLAVVHSNDLMPTNADGFFPFKQNSDLYYLSGIDQEKTVLLLFPEAPSEEDREILFIRKTNRHLAVWEGEKLSKEEASRRSGIKRVEWVEAFEGVLAQLVPQAKILYLLTNEHLRAKAVVASRNERFARSCQERFPLHKLERLAPLLAELRMCKEEAEVEQISKAIEITGAGFCRALEFIKPGVGEWEVEAEWAHEFLRNRSRGFAYEPIVASGKNACVLHYTQNAARCEEGELVLMDVGAEWANWNADLTRTVPVSGRFTKRQREVYEAVLRVQGQATAILRPGITLKVYQKQVEEMMAEELVRLGLITRQEAGAQEAEKQSLVKKYFPHGTSHHLGLDVHDVSLADSPVQVGMVFTVEPGLYINEENLGVRLENNIYVGERDNVDLFADIPIQPDKIEEIMNKE